MMQIKLPFILVLGIVGFTTVLSAQVDEKKLTELKKEEAKVAPDGWKTGGSFGLALDQLALFNPRIGAGENEATEKPSRKLCIKGSKRLCYITTFLYFVSD